MLPMFSVHTHTHHPAVAAPAFLDPHPRVGVLAAVMGDGAVRIYAIPRLDSPDLEPFRTVRVHS